MLRTSWPSLYSSRNNLYFLIAIDILLLIIFTFLTWWLLWGFALLPLWLVKELLLLFLLIFFDILICSKLGSGLEKNFLYDLKSKFQSWIWFDTAINKTITLSAQKYDKLVRSLGQMIIWLFFRLYMSLRGTSLGALYQWQTTFRIEVVAETLEGQLVLSQLVTIFSVTMFFWWPLRDL